MMVFILAALIIAPGLVVAQTSDERPVALLIKQLASSNFRIRQSAAEELTQRPTAEKALRKALPSADLDTRRRIQEILDYYDRRPLRELNFMVKEGRIEEFAKSAVAMPPRKYDAEVWFAVREFARTLRDLHEKKGGQKIKRGVLEVSDDWLPVFLSENRVTEATKARSDGLYLVRACEVDLDQRRRKNREFANELDAGCIIVAAGKVRLHAESSAIIIAEGSVQLSGCRTLGLLLISGGDVELDGDLDNSLIIARGKITINGANKISGCRIISGKTVALDPTTEQRAPNLITENDPNPLGYIRWSDPPKEKAAPKSK